MEQASRQSHADSSDENFFALPSTFSPWHNAEQAGLKMDLSHSEPQAALTGAKEPHQEEHLPPAQEEEPIAMSSSSPESSDLSPAPAIAVHETDQEEEELVLRPTEYGVGPRNEVVISAGEPATPSQQKRVIPRRTRFKEMLLSRSPKRNGSTSLGGGGNSYNPIGEDPPSASENIPMEPIDKSPPITEQRRDIQYDTDESDIDIDKLAARYERPPLDCHSRRDVYIKHRSWTYIVLAVLSVYSTLMSGLWLVVAIYQPRYGRGISSSEDGKMGPSTATLMCTLIAKTIEVSFVTVFVAFIGQVLTRRAFVRKAKGITIAEMTMRNWVIQPGSLLTYWEGIPYAATTLLGLFTLAATICAMFYTTASDAMVSPKLKMGAWESRSLEGLVKASYANPYYVQDSCSTPIDLKMDVKNSKASCLAVQYSGQSYQNLLTFMKQWQYIHDNGTSRFDQLEKRPVGQHILFDNTTLMSSWIEREYGDPKTAFIEHDRIVNNVTLAMPHPGVYSAAMDSRNDILQPDELAGVGEYSIRASVSSPVVNVMCVNMNRKELAPLVYTTWPGARNTYTNIPDQKIGEADWMKDVPAPSEDEWLNRTVVDDIFRWGSKYYRRPPVFQLYPIDYNMITNTSVANDSSIYILAKSGSVEDYTLCELRSWITPKCSTIFDVSGTSGASMRSHCEDPDDEDSYMQASGNDDVNDPPLPSIDWKNSADSWRLSMDLNGGTQNNNASNSRIMTHFILGEAALNPLLPSMAETLAVLASSTLVAGALTSTFRVLWTYYPLVSMEPGVYEAFHVSMRTQQYTSTHVESWQFVFYFVLGTVFAINLSCLLYYSFFRPGLVTDYTEPQNLFTAAINSPPSAALAGSCGHGPDSAEMVVPWRVAYSAAANHYFFEEATEAKRVTAVAATLARPFSEYSLASRASGSELLSPGRHLSTNYHNYKRLSSSKTWL